MLARWTIWLACRFKTNVGDLSTVDDTATGQFRTRKRRRSKRVRLPSSFGAYSASDDEPRTSALETLHNRDCGLRASSGRLRSRRPSAVGRVRPHDYLEFCFNSYTRASNARWFECRRLVGGRRDGKVPFKRLTRSALPRPRRSRIRPRCQGPKRSR